jgi:hypothetical protein
MRTELLALALVTSALCGSSCGGSGVRPDAALPTDSGGPQYDGGAKDSEAGLPDTGVDYGGHPEEAWASALDVPWSAGGTRQLTLIEIPPMVSATACGTGCQQVTFLPGYRSCTTSGDIFSVDGDYLSTSMYLPQNGQTHRCLQAYVDLRTMKAYAFAALRAAAPDLGLARG